MGVAVKGFGKRGRRLTLLASLAGCSGHTGKQTPLGYFMLKKSASFLKYFSLRFDKKRKDWRKEPTSRSS
jgi:hypothetical protein